MTKVEVIFLDAGDVLFFTPLKGEERIRKFLLGHGFKSEEIEQAILKVKKMTVPFISTPLEEEEYFTRYYGTVAEALDAKELTQDLCSSAHYAANCELFPEVNDVLDNLSPKYRLGVISNALPSMEGIFGRLGIAKYFEEMVFSAFAGVSKPSEGIYRQAIDRMKAESHSCVFIDDLVANVKGAERVGLKAIHLDRGKRDLRELLQEHQLLGSE